ncbi:hypothetical protein [Desulfoscipio gibsoniae]|uniref:Uncharacterized protein n=1 Tax=Desulfoscipio gibsoniae DSM 7213 TaxID=767817 RepID=R4KIS3_9FIRM|nr:hypothetical protein [Desulfoscipio gibsoniae]AGL03118.1 hypothetical protein Desgi_3796 [Desulfoscipio gibsoniae DSM 7213]
MDKTGNDYPKEVRDTTILAQRVRRDLTWVVVSMAVALAAAAGTYMTLTK